MKVSVAVISYNAENTILATLDSILAQDYGADRIELLISDDASTDATVETARVWLENNKTQFYATQLIVNKENLGVSANYNVACKACAAQWIKVIAADDLLLDNCISSNMRYVIQNPSAKAVFSYMKCFGANEHIFPSASSLSFFRLCAKKQNLYLRYFSFNIAPTQFINSDLLKNIGYADEKYRLVEDLPLWLKITANDVRLHFTDAVTVKYRVGNSVSTTLEKFINKDFVNCCLLINQEGKVERFPSLWFFLNREERIILRYKLFLSKVFGNRKDRIKILLFNMVWLITPISFFYRVKRRL